MTQGDGRGPTKRPLHQLFRHYPMSEMVGLERSMIDPSILQDPAIAGITTELGVSLATLAAKGTPTVIAARVKSFKEIKSANEVRAAYDELLSELLQERSEAILIAQAYKDALERVQISDEDIESLDNTIGRILDIIGISSDSEDASSEAQSQRVVFEQFRALIAADTLKTLQLIGFNFKAAIGEPLTRLCADKISRLGGEDNKGSNSTKANRRR